MRLPAYPEYEPSGVEWLGEVPEHWRVRRLGRLAPRIGSGKTPKGGAETYQSEGIMLIRSQDVYDDGLRLADVAFIDEETDAHMASTRVLPGDVLLNITGASLGRCAIAPRDLARANVNQHVCIVRARPSEVLPRFLWRAVTSHVVRSQVLSCENGSSREGLNFHQVRNLLLAVPPVHEQRAIAAFLDRETARLDALVEKKQGLIELLKEKRSALISRTVTRGLPPDAARAAGLTPHPKLKPSGIEWLGEVPEHWATRRLRHISDGITVGVVVNPSDYVSDEGVPFLLGGNVREFAIDLTKCNRCSQEISNGPLRKSRLAAGDLVVVRVGYPGVAAVVPPELEGANCASMMIVRRSPRFCSQWLAYVLNSQAGRDQIELVQYGAAQKQFNISHAVDFAFPFPQLAEQRAISHYLDCETVKISRMVAKVEEAVARLQEYRAALITAAVTGKIDVRGIAGMVPAPKAERQ